MTFQALFHNHLLLSALLGWGMAQIVKTVLYAVANGRLDLHRLVGDGGMPSGHSATVCAMATTAAVEYGLDSAVFALAAVLGIIVMHDAMGVRREAGRHARALNELLSDSTTDPQEKLKEFLGHTPLQVCVGAALGVVVALLLRDV
jgi:acid phosphatase family membrane protein YuiD